MNKLKLLSPRLLTLVLLVLPVALGTVYYGLIAKDRYVSHAVIGVKDTGGSSGGGGSSALAGLLGGSTATSYSDTFYLERYIQSMDLLLKLDSQLKLRDHYGDAGLDPVYKLWSWSSRESFLDYFRNRVEITHDDLSGLVTVDVQGFDPAYAQQLAQGVLRESEGFINEYSHRMARERMTFAESEVERARNRLTEIKTQVLAFQTTHKLLDPGSQAAAASSLTAALQAKLSSQEADLKAAQAILQEDSYQVKTLRSQIAATQAQLDSEKTRSTAQVNGSQLPALNIEYQELLTRAAFAEEAHKAALLALEQARVDATRKLKALVVIEPPTLPEAAIYPRRLYNLLTVLVLAALFYAIVRLVIATIREHQD